MELHVRGMTCDGCANAVRRSIGKVAPSAKVEIELASHRERLGEGLDAQLSAVGADEADLTGTNAVVVPVFWLLRRCYG
mgnify:CR=1 FL=1